MLHILLPSRVARCKWKRLLTFLSRFRTYFPEDYKRFYPNATSTRERATPQGLSEQAAAFSKSRRKEREPFSKVEDENLLIGFGRYSGKWSMIQKDPTLGLTHRRSTDLRDRFRNAFPDKYVGAGFKPPPAKKRRRGDGAENGVAEEGVSATQAEPTFQVIEETVAAVRNGVEPMVHDEAMVADVGFTNTRLPTVSTGGASWVNSSHHVARAKEAEMVAKLRAALDMGNMESAMGDGTDIPLDPGLSDVAYQPGGQADAEALKSLLDATSQRRNWKGE
jgi:hypothetical protein